MARKGKSRKAARKRFKITGSGKITRRRGRFAHLLTKKSSRRKRRCGSSETVQQADARALRRMLPS